MLHCFINHILEEHCEEDTGYQWLVSNSAMPFCKSAGHLSSVSGDLVNHHFILVTDWRNGADVRWEWREVCNYSSFLLLVFFLKGCDSSFFLYFVRTKVWSRWSVTSCLWSTFAIECVVPCRRSHSLPFNHYLITAQRMNLSVIARVCVRVCEFVFVSEHFTDHWVWWIL